MQAMLKGKVILLTGGADGIGWECAKAYAAAGAQVVVADWQEEKRGKMEELPGEGHAFHACDVASGAAVAALFAAIAKKYGRLDAIHNNAGLAHPAKALHDTEDAEWEALMRVNLKSIYLTTRQGIDLLRASKGCILNTSSLVGSIGQDNHAAYVATKGAVNALTKAMALDYAPAGIRVNAVAPAAIRTPMLEAWAAQQPEPEAMQRYLDQLQPLGAMPAGDVIADACVFLLSDAARFITGCILPVTGGAELGYRALI
ncbi:SDR family oxidoreductase [Chitinophaga pollutisoli]|uniref:SDR family oxidoreductase n=1 Tax=Chitinophaga pollutisoli TaxID=3133966 RepID=A0ABZ2YS76_9BACT